MVALQKKKFPFLKPAKLQAKIDEIAGATDDGDLEAKKADIRAQIEAGNPS